MKRISDQNRAIFDFIHVMRRFWPEISVYRWLISGAFLLLLLEVAFRLLEPWPLKFIFDRVIVSTPSEGLSNIELIDQMNPNALLLYSCIAVVVFAGLRAVCAYGATVGFALAGNRIMTKIRHRLYQHIQCLSLTYHSKSRKGDLIIRVISDVGLLQEVMVTAALPLLGNLLVLIGILVVMTLVNWQLSLVALSIIPIFWLFTIRQSKRIQKASRKQRRMESDLAATASESFAAIKTVQALSLEDSFEESFTQVSNKNLKEGVKAKRLAAGLERTVDLLIALATALVLWLGAQLVLRGNITPGDLIVFTAYLKNAFKPLRNFAKYTGRLAKASAAGERILEVFDSQIEVKNTKDAISAPQFIGDIQFEDVSFAYDSKNIVLDKINFTVSAGEKVALIAPSGAGKTTLVGLILRLFDPTQGQVLIDGKNIKYYTLESLRPQISMVLQDSYLFAGTIRENITWGLNDVKEEQIIQAAQLANAHDFIKCFPEQYDTPVGEQGATLSNGQRQRIAIARAAIRNTPILILDEPTSALDKESEKEVLDAIYRLMKNKTTFLITHNLDLTAEADKIIYLENGKVRT